MRSKILNGLDLKREYKSVTGKLALLNRELAENMISLAEQTGETRPLIQALNALHSARQTFTIESTPRENAEIQQLMANTLLKIGRQTDDVRCLEHAIKAYRGAITLASMLGDDTMRRELKRDYSLARNLIGQRGSNQSLLGVA